MADEPLHPTRVCRKCGVEKPADTEHFNKKLDGLTSQCRPCRNAAKRSIWAERADETNARRRAARGEAERERDRARYAANDRKKLSVQRWRARNPERRAAHAREDSSESTSEARVSTLSLTR